MKEFSNTQKMLRGLSDMLGAIGNIDTARLVLDTMISMLNGISTYSHEDAVLSALGEAQDA